MRYTLKDIQKSTARIADSTSIPPSTSIANVPKANPIRLLSRRTIGFTPHDILWDAVRLRWPQLAIREYEGAVPGRKYRIDIAFPEHRLALEVDGWAHHGRFLKDFIRDRERQNLLCVHGWRVLRFSAGAIRKQLDRQVMFISVALQTKPQSNPVSSSSERKADLILLAEKPRPARRR